MSAYIWWSMSITAYIPFLYWSAFIGMSVADWLCDWNVINYVIDYVIDMWLIMWLIMWSIRDQLCDNYVCLHLVIRVHHRLCPLPLLMRLSWSWNCSSKLSLSEVWSLCPVDEAWNATTMWGRRKRRMRRRRKRTRKRRRMSGSLWRVLKRRWRTRRDSRCRKSI